jgi:hypothetical protein
MLICKNEVLTQVECHGHQVVLLDSSQHALDAVCIMTYLAHDWEAHDTVTLSMLTNITAE